MDCEYFLDKATPFEIDAFVDGRLEQSHEAWCRTRLSAFIAAKIGGSKASTMEEFMPFNWEKKEEEEEETNIEDLRALAKRLEKCQM